MNANDEPLDIAKLISLCISGDESAWAKLFETYGRLIYAIPSRFGFTDADCDEIFQEVSLEIVNGLESIQQPDRLQAWIVTITRRTCIRRFRQQKNKKIIEIEEWDSVNANAMDDGVISRLELMEERVLLYRAMEQLGPKCQQLLTELYLSDKDLAYAEIAEKLDMPVGSIGPTRQRCIEQLRKAIEKLRFKPQT